MRQSHGINGPSCPLPQSWLANVRYHITDSTAKTGTTLETIWREFCLLWFEKDVRILSTSTFSNFHISTITFFSSWRPYQKGKLKISRAFCLVSSWHIFACHINFCWESLLGGFHMLMATPPVRQLVGGGDENRMSLFRRAAIFNTKKNVSKKSYGLSSTAYDA